MKLHLVLLLIILTLFFTSCTKKESVVVKPVIDSVKKADAVVQVQSKIYPFTDTFVGGLRVYFGSLSSGYNNKNDSFEFYVTHRDSISVTVINSNYIQLENCQGSDIFIDDVMVLNSNTYLGNKYLGDMHLFFTDGEYPVVKNAITFILTNNSLTVNWDLGGVRVLGICDFGESIGQFNGVRSNKTR
jgi:hypothetical protein